MPILGVDRSKGLTPPERAEEPARSEPSTTQPSLWQRARQLLTRVLEPVSSTTSGVLTPPVSTGVTVGGGPSRLATAPPSAAKPLVATEMVSRVQQRLTDEQQGILRKHADAAKLEAAKLHRLGVHLDLAHTAELAPDDPHHPFDERSYAADPAVVALLHEADLSGFKSGGVVAVSKHFPGHFGSPSNNLNTDAQPITIARDLGELARAELIPFQWVVDHGGEVVMVGHAEYPRLAGRVPASMSREIVTDILRGRLGFDGVIMTDALNAGAVEAFEPSLPCRVERTLRAGNDIALLFFYPYPSSSHQLNAERSIPEIVPHVANAVRNGSIPEAQIDASVRRILELKSRFFGEQLFADAGGATTIESLIERMTIEEKIGQMLMVTGNGEYLQAVFARWQLGAAYLGRWSENVPTFATKIPVLMVSENPAEFSTRRVGRRFVAAMLPGADSSGKPAAQQ